jgi:cytochrome b pre-mRNA-processing protein 3
MIFGSLFRRSPLKDRAATLYGAAVRQARQPAFYADCAVPDSVDGRFDLIVLHVFLVLRRLRQAGEVGERLGRAVLEVLCDDMDQNLREMGVGDLSVGKKVKHMVRSFYGRAKAYDGALEPGSGPTALEEALERNIYGRSAPRPDQLAALGAYVRAAAGRLEQQPVEALARGEVVFPAAPEPELNRSASTA